MTHADPVLVCWVGHTDLRAAEGLAEAGLGPIGQAVAARGFRRVRLLGDEQQRPRTEAFVAWLAGQSGADVSVTWTRLSTPVALGEIYEAARRHVTAVRDEVGLGVPLTYHLSPGTWAMSAAWVLLARTRFEAELIQSSIRGGVGTADIPLDVSAEFLPDLLAPHDAKLRDGVDPPPPASPEFGAVVHRSAAMAAIVALARRVAVRNVPVLIEGETGTGKELFARAIHVASSRRGPFIAVNCGAIPANLVEPELFGHTKGAFSGAVTAREGHLRAASGGTLFLDEIGELPREAQVKLLRALQEQEVVPVGASKAVPVDVRVVCATHRDLSVEAAAGRFREDLLYRLAVAVLTLPPLRDRPGDVDLIADTLLRRINDENRDQPSYAPKSLTPGARKALKLHPWPGNVRELHNVLQRAAVWTEGARIDERAVAAAIRRGPVRSGPDVLGRSLGEGFHLEDVLAEVARHYLTRALAEADGSKTAAAALLGLNSHQVLTNWVRKYLPQADDL